MKNLRLLFSLVLAVTFFTVSFGQKVQKEKLGSYKYTQLPSDTRLVDYQTFKVEARGEYGDSYRRDAIEARISMAGYDKRSKREEADLVIAVEEYPLRYTEAERKSSTRTVKNKDGVEKKVTSYWYESSCTYKYVLRVYNDVGEELAVHQNTGSEKISGSTSESTSNAWENYKVGKSNFEGSVIGDKVGYLNVVINNTYAFPKKSLSVELGKIKPKKHNYDDLNGTIATIKEEFEIVRLNEEDIDPAALKFEEAKKALDKVLEESDIENRKARISKDVTAVVHYNVALGYFMLKDYASAAKCLKSAIELKSGLFSAKALLRRTEDLQKRVETNS